MKRKKALGDARVRACRKLQPVWGGGKLLLHQLHSSSVDANMDSGGD
jgi:hypothetical protein